MTCDADSNLSVTVVPACSDDLLLRFPYDVNYDDISCHNAKGYAYGEGTVDIVPDAERGMVAEFDGKTRLEVTYIIVRTLLGMSVGVWSSRNMDVTECIREMFVFYQRFIHSYFDIFVFCPGALYTAVNYSCFVEGLCMQP